jgi:hypothetical protein
VFTTRAGRSNRLEFSAFEIRGTSNTVATQDLVLFGDEFEEDEPLVTDYRIRNAKFSLNYLTFPNPPADSKLRFKTLWEVQYAQIRTLTVAPLRATSDVPAFPTPGSRTVFLPTVGLGVEVVPSPRHFRLDIRASGLGFPNRSAILDGEAAAVIRAGRHLELFGGYKAFYVRTSPKKDHFFSATIGGPFFGIRWVFR